MHSPRGVGTVVLVAALSASVGLAIGRTQGTVRTEDAAAIRAHIESIFQAFIDKDRPKLAATHGVNWRGFLTGSPSVIRGREAECRAFYSR